MKVTTKSVLDLQKEIGKTYIELSKEIDVTQSLDIATGVLMLKHALGGDEEKAMQMFDEVPGIIVETYRAYNEWHTKAFTIADSGNS